MTIEIRDDFDLRKIAESGQCFRWEDLGNGSWRIPFREQCLYITQAGEFFYTPECTPGEWDTIWGPYFDLDTDYSAIRSRIDRNRDPFLSRAAEACRGVRILRQDPWETLVSFIISQNRNIPAIRRSVALLCEAAGRRLTDCRGSVFFAFPEPESLLALGDDALDACRLGYRAKYVRAAARAAAEGRFQPDRLLTAPDEETMASLTGLYGVGIKVASCVSLFGLHHLDAFPVDVWIRRVLEKEYPAGYPRDRYSPYNGVYQQYMFAYYRNS